MIKLHLFQDIQYQKTSSESDLGSCYRSLFSNLFSITDGGEVCLEISYTCDDAASFKLITTAHKDPPTEEVKKAVDSGLPVPEIHNPAFSIPAGKYEFEQLIMLPEPSKLEGFLYHYCTSRSGTVFLRILRENAFSFVAQILRPVLPS